MGTDSEPPQAPGNQPHELRMLSLLTVQLPPHPIETWLARERKAWWRSWRWGAGTAILLSGCTFLIYGVYILAYTLNGFNSLPSWVANWFSSGISFMWTAYGLCFGILIMLNTLVASIGRRISHIPEEFELAFAPGEPIRVSTRWLTRFAYRWHGALLLAPFALTMFLAYGTLSQTDSSSALLSALLILAPFVCQLELLILLCVCYPRANLLLHIATPLGVLLLIYCLAMLYSWLATSAAQGDISTATIYAVYGIYLFGGYGLALYFRLKLRQFIKRSARLA